MLVFSLCPSASFLTMTECFSSHCAHMLHLSVLWEVSQYNFDSIKLFLICTNKKETKLHCTQSVLHLSLISPFMELQRNKRQKTVQPSQQASNNKSCFTLTNFSPLRVADMTCRQQHPDLIILCLADVAYLYLEELPHLEQYGLGAAVRGLICYASLC